MRARNLAAALAAFVALLLTGLLPAAATAAAQQEERQIRREVVVVGSQPTHRRVVLDQLANRAFLGVQLISLTPELRQHFGATRQGGVLVSRVTADSPADRAGVKVGDVITSIDGEPVRSTGQLVGRVGRRQQGDEVELQIVRDRAELTLTATLAQSERRQLEIGQFVWQGGDEAPMVFQLDPDFEIERFIAVDPETINESVGQLLERLEERGGSHRLLHLDDERRRQLEQRIAELEERLRSMELQLQRQRDAGGGGD